MSDYFTNYHTSVGWLALLYLKGDQLRQRDTPLVHFFGVGVTADRELHPTQQQNWSAMERGNTIGQATATFLLFCRWRFRTASGSSFGSLAQPNKLN
jgi:hypothetical protein